MRISYSLLLILIFVSLSEIAFSEEMGKEGGIVIYIGSNTSEPKIVSDKKGLAIRGEFGASGSVGLVIPWSTKKGGKSSFAFETLLGVSQRNIQITREILPSEIIYMNYLQFTGLIRVFPTQWFTLALGVSPALSFGSIDREFISGSANGTMATSSYKDFGIHSYDIDGVADLGFVFGLSENMDFQLGARLEYGFFDVARAQNDSWHFFSYQWLGGFRIHP